MAWAFSQERKGSDRQSFIYTGKLTPSGNYALGGEVVPFRGKMPTTKQPVFVDVRGKAGYVYEYDYANDKLLVRQEGAAAAPAVELAAAAYPAGVTGDDIRFTATYPKFG
jgi:hypothetical protein